MPKLRLLLKPVLLLNPEILLKPVLVEPMILLKPDLVRPCLLLKSRVLMMLEFLVERGFLVQRRLLLQRSLRLASALTAAAGQARGGDLGPARISAVRTAATSLTPSQTAVATVAATRLGSVPGCIRQAHLSLSDNSPPISHHISPFSKLLRSAIVHLH